MKLTDLITVNDPVELDNQEVAEVALHKNDFTHKVGASAHYVKVHLHRTVSAGQRT